MIRITIELLPLGREEQKRHLGTMEIWNDATGDQKMGNYGYKISKFGNPSSVWKSGKVKGFDRLSRGPWDLLCLVLLSAVGRRNQVKS